MSLLLLLLCSASATAEEPAITTDSLRRDVGFLASDALAGRGRGSDGGFAAAAFLARELRAAGLRPFEGAYRHEFGRTAAKKKVGPTEWAYDKPPTRMQNVLAVTRPSRGTDDPYLVIGAHYDHVGDGTRGGSRGSRGLIHNGADDNASGTAVVLAVARMLAQSTTIETDRPILFAFFDGEEAGLLGSQHLVKQYPRQFAAMINLDMVGAMKDDIAYVYGHSTAKSIARLVQEHRGDLDLRLMPEHCPRSDQAWFYYKGVPYLFYHTGLHPRYHRQSDDADLLNYDGMQRIATAVLRIAEEMADPATSLEFDPESKKLPYVKSPPWQQ